MRGADPEQLDALALRFEESAERLDGSLRQVSQLISGAEWRGRDRDEFGHLFTSQIEGRLQKDVATLSAQASLLRRQAAEQRRASEGGGVGSSGATSGLAGSAVGVGAVGAVAANSRWLANGVERLGSSSNDGSIRSLSGYMDELSKLPEGTMRIIRIEGDPPRYVVLMKGIDGFERPLDSYRTDLADAVAERFSKGGAWGDAVKTALADAMKDDIAAGKHPQVMLMGHSGGGIAAANLAADPSFNAAIGGKYNLTDVVIAGSGVADKIDRIPVGTNVLMLHHSTDVVANAIQNPATAAAVGAPGLVRGEVVGLEMAKAAQLTHGGNHQVDVFDAGWRPTDQALGLSGHDQVYYADELKHLSKTHNHLVSGMEQRYSSGGSTSSHYYRLHD